MTPVEALGTACAACTVVAVVLAVLGFRWLLAARRVRRVRVPARELHSTYIGPGTFVDVEYPGPDGRPLRGSMFVWLVRAPGVPYTFDGTVWVDPADPTDITPRLQGRTTRATLTLIFAAIALVAALGTGMGAFIANLGETFPA